VLLTYWAALAFVARRAALIAALMMASSILLGVEARLAKTDAMLLLTSVAAMARWRASIWSRAARPRPCSVGRSGDLWTALAGGVLLKGPLILMFVALTALTLSIADRSWRWMLQLRPLAGFAWLIVLVLPWFIAIVAKSGDSFFMKAVGDDMLSKITSGQEAHARPRLLLAAVLVTFWPGCVLAGLAAPMVWKARRERAHSSAGLGGAVMDRVRIVMTKLPHYVLPLYPAIAILISGIWSRAACPRRAGWCTAPSLVRVPGGHRGRGGAGFIWIGHDPGIIAWPFARQLWCSACSPGGFTKSTARTLVAARMIASVFISITVYAVMFPLLPPLFPSKLIAMTCAERLQRTASASTFAYQEPSLVFMLGTARVLPMAPAPPNISTAARAISP